jgi:hypothetical protein
MTKKGKIQKITISKMLKLEPSTSVSLSDEFLEGLKPEADEYAIVILTSNKRIIRIIPTATNKVYKIAIDIGKYMPDFLRKLGNIINDLNLKTLYSTGLCFVDEKCVFDTYIDSSEYERIDSANFQKEINAIEGVSNITISEINAK